MCPDARAPAPRRAGAGLRVALAVCCASWLACSEPDRPAAPEPSASRTGAEETGADTESHRPPNVLLVTLDTVRADALGVYGQTRPTTPTIDAIARAGVLFEQASTSHAETLPSHSTLLTGKLPFAHGVRANSGFVLSERNETLAEVLKRAGYATGVEIAAPVLRKETQITQGFDHYRGAESPDAEHKLIRYTTGPVREESLPMRTASDVSNRAIDFIREHREEPFFLWLHYFDAHVPHSAPGRFNQRIPDSPYHAEVASADAELGRVVRELDRLGLSDETLLVVTADHGEGLGDHGESSHSYLVYDSTMHVPLIFAGLPALTPGLRIHAPVRTADVAPTILDLVGQPPLEGVQGVSLRPLLSGASDDLGLVAYGEATRFNATLGLPTLRFVRDGGWKYIHKTNPELYDVESDPGEQTNLATERPDVAKRLRAELEAMLADTPGRIDDAQAEIDAATAEQLIALGYVARSPMLDVEDDVEGLPTDARDPMDHLADVEDLSKASGFAGRKLYDRALELLLPILARNPDSPYVVGQTAVALLGLERTEEAAALLEHARALEPESVDVMRSLAGAYADLGRSAEAAKLMQRLLESEPCDEAVLVSLGDRLRALERYAELVEMQSTGARKCPDLLVNKNNYAWTLATLPAAELRDGERAVAVIEETLERAGTRDPGYLDTLAAALAETGDFERARRVQAEAVAAFEAGGAPPEILEQVRAHLASFEAGEPLRVP